MPDVVPISNTKIRKWILTLIKVVFTAFLLVYSGYQVHEQFELSDLGNSLNQAIRENAFYIVLILLMSFSNWALEAWRWKVSLSYPISFLDACKATLTGLGFSVLLPRIAGESIGRYWKTKENKEDVVSTLALTKAVMAMVTGCFGIIGLIYFNAFEVFEWNSILFYLGIGVTVLILVLVIVKFQWIKRQKYLKAVFVMSGDQLFGLFAITIARYASFIAQTFVVMLFLGVVFDFWPIVMCLTVLYLVRMGTVSINVFVDLGIRFSTSIFVFQQLQVLTDVSLLISMFTCIWLANVILPSSLGALLISIDRK